MSSLESRLRRRGRLAGVIFTSTTLVATIVGVAGPASAAIGPVCNTESANHPEYIDHDGLHMNCYQNASQYYGVPTRAIQSAYDICYSKKYGWPAIAADGYYGSATTAAVKRIQSFHGITADGMYGPVTATTMRFPVLGQQGVCQAW